MNSLVKSIIFSKDRPIQLLALLESFSENCLDFNLVDKSVVYKASTGFEEAYLEIENIYGKNIAFIKESNFVTDVSKLLMFNKSDFVMFLVDDIIFKDRFLISDCANYLDKDSDCFTFSLRLGRGLNYCYPTNTYQIEPIFQQSGNILSFDHLNAQGDWGYPFSLDGNIFRTSEFVKFYDPARSRSPNSMESMLSLKKSSLDHRKLACFETSKLLNNPDNRVQEEIRNRSESQNDYIALLERWNDGLKIDISKVRGLKNNSCHYPFKFEFIKR